MKFFKTRTPKQQWTLEATLKEATLKSVITAPTLSTAVTKFLVLHPGAEVLSVRQYNEYYHY